MFSNGFYTFSERARSISIEKFILAMKNRKLIIGI